MIAMISNQIMIVASKCLMVITVVVGDVACVTVSPPASNCWWDSRPDAKICAISPLTVGVKLITYGVPCWLFPYL